MQYDGGQALANLNALVTEFETAKPKSELFQMKFGDWESISCALKDCAEKFQPSSWQARRLQELSNCRDSKQDKYLNIGTTKQVTEKVFRIIKTEFFTSQDQAEQDHGLEVTPT